MKVRRARGDNRMTVQTNATGRTEHAAGRLARVPITRRCYLRFFFHSETHSAVAVFVH